MRMRINTCESIDARAQQCARAHQCARASICASLNARAHQCACASLMRARINARESRSVRINTRTHSWINAHAHQCAPESMCMRINSHAHPCACASMRVRIECACASMRVRIDARVQQYARETMGERINTHQSIKARVPQCPPASM